MSIKIQVRRDTAANWTASNPTLSAGEPAYETDTGKQKIGDGSTTWASLAYAASAASLAAVSTVANAAVAKGDDIVNVKTYGAKGDTKTVTTGAMTSGSATLTATGAAFVAGDVGKTIVVYGAGVGLLPLITTITAWTNSTVVTVGAAAGGTVSAAEIVWGTDDTVAVQAAMNTGKNVLVPQGMFLVNPANGLDPATVPFTGCALYCYAKGQNLTGAGRGVTTLFNVPTTSSIIIYTGGVLSGMKIDGGFRPTAGWPSDLSGMILAGSRTVVRDCHLLSSRGTCVDIGSYSTFANNIIEKFGDHAIYAPSNAVAGGTFMTDIHITGNTILEDATYHNSVNGTNRGAIKLREMVRKVTITGNTVTADSCVLLTGRTDLVEGIPAAINITGNTFTATYSGVYMETNDGTGADAGFRISDVVIAGNTIGGSTLVGAGVVLRTSSALIQGNSFEKCPAGISGFDDPPGPVWSVLANRFNAGAIHLYKPPTGSAISRNHFIGATNVSIYDAVATGPGLNVTGNTFLACNKGIKNGTATSTTARSVYSQNVFQDGVSYPIELQSTSRAYTITDNIFVNNTVACIVGNGASFNLLLIRGNKAPLGPSFPATSTDSVTLVTDPAAAAGATSADVQVFTASGTWSKPPAAVTVRVYLIGGGGGGGSGRRHTAGVVRCGGGGGGGGGKSVAEFLAGDLGATATVTVGTGGAGASGASANSTDGAAGTAGTATTFTNLLRAGNGGAGAGGTVSTGTGGGTGGATFNGTSGGAAATTGSTGVSAASSNGGGTGGGSGGGVTVGDSHSAGGTGAVPFDSTVTTAVAGGTVPGGNGADGAARTAGEAFGGSGGGGGAGSISGAGGAGGAGGIYGGGGGGGGASLNGNNSGGGGTGANGIAVVVTIF